MFRKRVGVVGMGNISKIIAQKWIGAFECEIVAYDPYVPADPWKGLCHIQVNAFGELLKDAEGVTLHVPPFESTRGLISDHEFSIMKANSILVNCTRGGVVDEKALRRALDKKKIGGAALDVMEIEPPTLDVYGEFLKHENVITTPHIGGSTKENQSRTGRAVVETLMDVLEGREATGKLV